MAKLNCFWVPLDAIIRINQGGMCKARIKEKRQRHEDLFRADGRDHGRGFLADLALGRRLRGGSEATEEEIRAWYMALYEGWAERFHPTMALGRIKKLMEWPTEGNIRRRRLLRRAKDIEECIRAVTEE